MSPPFTCVVTTIQPPTDCMRELARRLAECGAAFLVVGDAKGPSSFELAGAELLDLARQRALGFELAALLPTGHYARKNLGYLEAISRGAPCLYETDDDNRPTARWTPASPEVSARRADAPGWLNVYALFTDQLVWPRGLPLDEIRRPVPAVADARAVVRAPIQQTLVDAVPDVDAVWRLVLDRELSFDVRPSVWLAPGTWCPFNSQATWWWPEAYPLLYLPSTCTFRMTDIWRSLVAQRCLWAMGLGVVFHAADVEQDRNVHVLLRDFEHEVPGYLGNAAIARRLEALDLARGEGTAGENLLACYEDLVAAGYFAESELDLVRAWVRDVRALLG